MTRRALLLVLLVGVGRLAFAQAPAAGPPLPPDVTVLAVNDRGHLVRSLDHGVSWEAVADIPTRVLPASRRGEPLPITAVTTPAPDPDDVTWRQQLARFPGLKRPDWHIARPGEPALVAYGGTLLVSRDAGESFIPVVTSGAINASTYITSLAVDPRDHDHWLAGTSYDGLFQTRDGGATWTDLTETRSLWPSYLGTGFFEEFERLWFTADGIVIAGLGFGQGYVRIELPGPVVTRLGPFEGTERSYDQLNLVLGSGGGRPAVEHLDSPPVMDLPRDTGIYLAAPNAVPEKLPGYFALAERFGYTSLVVDFKDDEGRLTYASELEIPRAAGAVVPVIEPDSLIAAAHARGLRIIARIVVFKDRRLYAWDNNRYAIWNSGTNRPWGVFRTYTNEETGERRTVQVEHWVDAYSPEVWDYNVAVAEEIEALGVDEIQFDYIRFPSDGINETVQTRFRPEGADRVQALEGFLSAARERITIPISIDVFGFNAWARMSYLGQDITRLARYVDAISPMFYPSHFARSFLPQFSYLDRSHLIYDLGSRRAAILAATTHPGTQIRPYVQAFLIHEELEFERPTYLRYLELQLEGVAAAEAATDPAMWGAGHGGEVAPGAAAAGGPAHTYVSGYSLWNASGRYYMLP